MNATAFCAAEINGEIMQVMLADMGAYALSGDDAGLAYGRVFHADGGDYAVVGAEPAFLRGYVTSAEGGHYSSDGFAAGSIRGYQITGQPGDFVLNGLLADMRQGIFYHAQERALQVPADRRRFGVQREPELRRPVDGRVLRVPRENRTLTVSK